MARKIPLYFARIGNRPERINRKDVKWRNPDMSQIYVKWNDVAPHIKEGANLQHTTRAAQKPVGNK